MCSECEGMIEASFAAGFGLQSRRLHLRHHTAKITLGMRDALYNGKASRSRPPSAFWIVAGLAILTIIGFFGQSNPTSVNWGGALIEILVLVGLAAGSQLCRWFLLITSLGGAIVIFGNQLNGVAAGDVVLGFACLIQAALLCTPAMRVYTRSPTSMN